MPLIYSVVARGTAVLAEYSEAKGNFVQISHLILGKVNTSENGRKSYSYDTFFFFYVVENGLVYLCMADNQMKSGIAFAFLDDIKNRFLTTYRDRYQSASAYSFNEEFSRTLNAQMKYFSSPAVDKTAQIRMKIEETKEVMVQNIERLLERAERIEILVDKTNDLENNAVTFKNQAVKLKRAMWCKNVKMWLILIAVLVILAWLVSSLVCGFDYKKCASGTVGQPPVEPTAPGALAPGAVAPGTF